uniref:Uncharacterized protein n=1 Tax=Anguilla anguilla TaxID=7936 RepID=A0A0E9SI24_ANGAN
MRYKVLCHCSDSAMLVSDMTEY